MQALAPEKTKSAPSDDIDFATAADIRAMFRQSVPSQAREAVKEFQTAFNNLYSAAKHEPYRLQVDEMVKQVGKISQAGLDNAQKIMGALDRTGVTKALVAHDNGVQMKGLPELAAAHQKLSEVMPKLQQYVTKLDDSKDLRIGAAMPKMQEGRQDPNHKAKLAGLGL